VPVAPTIGRQPNGQPVLEGQSVTFAVVASGAAPLSYQWQRNQVALAGEVGTTLVLPAVTLAEDGDRFRCVVTSVVGSATSGEATLTVSPLPMNDPPTAAADGYAVDEGGSVVTDAASGVLANDTDADADALEAALLSGPANGTLTLAADGSFSYQHDGSETLSGSFVYEARGKVVGKVSIGNQTSYTLSGLDGGQTYYIVVTAHRASGLEESAFSNEIVVEIPLAAFTGSPEGGVSPFTVAFSDASTGNISSWSWNFGDGTTSTAQNTSHISEPRTCTRNYRDSGGGCVVSSTSRSLVPG
jgi:hypothetical protein